jgi:uncharacterized protein YkwD
MMRFTRALLASVLAVVGLLGSVAPQLAEGASLDSAEQDLVGRINAFRAARSLPTLAVSDTLTSAAKWMSLDMGARNYFAHTSLDGRSPTQRMADAGYPAFGTWTGEDLAAGYTVSGDVLNGWINSPAHYAVLVNPQYRAIGVGRGYATGSTYGWYWAADFGGVVDAARAVPVSRASVPAAAPQLHAIVVPERALPPDPGYHASWSAQSADPTMTTGATAKLVVALKNTGLHGWYNDDGAGPHVVIGTNDPQDADRSDLAGDWLSANRVTSTTTAYVGPGEIGWFEFTVRAPAGAGDYRLALRPVVDGIAWLEDDGIYFTIHAHASLNGWSGVSFAP